MPPAIIAGGIAAAGTIGGALLSSHAQSSAANQANQAEQSATQAQLQLGQQSLAQQAQLAQQSMGLNQSIYNSNYDLLSPFVSRGNVAGNQINSMLGLPNAPAMHSPLETSSGGLAPIQLPPQPTPAAGTPAPSQPAYSGPSLAQIMAMQHDGIPGNYAAGMAQYNAANPTAQAQQSGGSSPANALFGLAGLALHPFG